MHVVRMKRGRAQPRYTWDSMTQPSAAAAAVRTLEATLETRPLDLALHQQLGRAHDQLLQQPECARELTAICSELPFAFTSRLHLAVLHHERGDRRAAVIGFTRAIKTAQLRGFWFDEGSTPPWLRPVVLRGMDIAHDGKADVFDQILAPLIARYGEDELARVTSALAMWLGLEPTVYADPRQKPRFLYISGLPIAPVFSRDALPFADWYEAQTEAITREMRAALDGTGVQEFHYDVPAARRGELVEGTWDAYFFF